MLEMIVIISILSILTISVVSSYGKRDLRACARMLDTALFKSRNDLALLYLDASKQNKSVQRQEVLDILNSLNETKKNKSCYLSFTASKSSAKLEIFLYGIKDKFLVRPTGLKNVGSEMPKLTCAKEKEWCRFLVNSRAKN